MGFALTILQRRLASSPEAIYQSLRRRRERLEKRLREEQLLKRGAEAHAGADAQDLPAITTDDLDDLDDAPDARGRGHSRSRSSTRPPPPAPSRSWRPRSPSWPRLEALAQRVRLSGTDRKWEELAPASCRTTPRCSTPPAHRRKLVIFTEHRDTLNYLTERRSAHCSATIRGRRHIHGGMGREERRKAQEAFTHDKEVQILVATDAAGEGINLQRAHLMVNYDLPWNPNRLEQRFGRIHRIGQTEVCHLWNLVAKRDARGRGLPAACLKSWTKSARRWAARSSTCSAR